MPPIRVQSAVGLCLLTGLLLLLLIELYSRMRRRMKEGGTVLLYDQLLQWILTHARLLMCFFFEAQRSVADCVRFVGYCATDAEKHKKVRPTEISFWHGIKMRFNSPKETKKSQVDVVWEISTKFRCKWTVKKCNDVRALSSFFHSRLFLLLLFDGRNSLLSSCP